MERFVIAMTRKCGSGATTISKMLAQHYGIDLYDRKLLQLASEDSGINEALFANADERVKSSLLYRACKKVYSGELIPPESNDFTSNDNLFNYQAKVLKELAERESYIVIGRGADFILKDYKNLISIFLYADENQCMRHQMDQLCCDEKEALRYIKKINKYRSGYYKYHTGQSWENPNNYDLCIHTGKLTYEQTVDLIKEYVAKRIEKKEG